MDGASGKKIDEEKARSDVSDQEWGKHKRREEDKGMRVD